MSMLPLKIKRYPLKKNLGKEELMKIKNHLMKFHIAVIRDRLVQNNVEFIKQKLDRGLDPNFSDQYGRSLLHIATTKGYADMVKLLLDNGADPNIRDKRSNTPLHLAACSHNFVIINLLIKAGADANSLDCYGKNPLELARSKLTILQKSLREGLMETGLIRNEMHMIIEMLMSVSKRNNVELGLMHLSVNDPETVIDDQMSKLLTDLEQIKLS